MATLSKGGTAWLTKLRRIRELSKGDKSVVFNNIGHIIDEDFLRDCFLQLDGTKAVGIDGVNKEKYGENLDENIKELLKKIRRGIYECQPSRIVEIPKDDGSKRPLAIACMEDKIVQSAVNRILQEIYEPIFLPCSFGFRPERNAHIALKELLRELYRTPAGVVIDIDIRKYFNTVPHGPLEMLLNKKISDSRFLGLIHKLLVAPTIDSNGMTRRNECGVPQGSILSPVLSNIYLHHVVDEWVEELKAFFRYGLSVIRYADDMVFVFQNENDGVRFFETLPKRLAKYGLEMAVEKSSVVPTGRFTISRLIESGNGMPKFNFLGFEVFWTKTRAGKHYRGRVRPRPDRMNKRLKEIKEFLRKSRATQDHMSIIQKVKRVVDGWMRYFAVTDCGADVHNFSSKVRRMLFRWFNRRGCNNAVRWDKMQKILDSINYNQVIPIYSLISNSSTKS